ncbi:hypothetical protein OG618_37235 (plasmid) [Kitasatospora sp. NBC_01246]|uniref:hypothetical protein n=1 Tax=Kitasatospora sp. NBC_01246 TaxID=2903570 RepID=UPI002E335C22|nr:hypothetical protein [Kitasatospora sp. NBC_01246]
MAVAGAVVVGAAGCSAAAADGGQDASAGPAATTSSAAASTGAGEGAQRGRALVADLEARLQPPMTVRCLSEGGRECVVWLGGVGKVATVDVPNHLDRFPVGGERAARVREMVERIGAAGDLYHRGGCEELARFEAKSTCEQQAAGVVVGARLLASELKAQWP